MAIAASQSLLHQQRTTATTATTARLKHAMVVPHELEHNFRTISLNDFATKTTKTTTSTGSTTTPGSASSSPYDNDDEESRHHDHHHTSNNTQQAAQAQAQQQQSEERTIRLEMISILRQKCSTATPTATHCNHRLVCDLERLLWRQSKQDIGVYSDMTTLQSRLKSLMTMLLVRRSKKPQQNTTMKNSTNHSTTTNRSRANILLQKMGQERYQKAKMVVQAINDAKLQYVVRHTKNCCRSAKTCSIRGGDGSSPSPPPPALPEALPVPVKRLYFSTRLVPIFHKTPLQQLVRVGGDGYGYGGNGVNSNLVYWDKLLQEAEQNLKMFQEWKDQENNNNNNNDDDDIIVETTTEGTNNEQMDE
eukprot:CAMPEP_0113455328 /NCGR_PEP_ID=MMETSP0014_2-20120614/8319_1 /TAXON_ID=2857 /ORGANISM="Nitzschia sp." /LENGTH=361 /DNA_ID=CAMNT_0000346755 /DNA_START=299 /DNA_END=1384 /DNA_ORIENTATION=- /assembly_acc=CAM_ASM_000159